MKNVIWTYLKVLLVGLSLSTIALAETGIVTTSIGPSDDRGFANAVQPDGKIVVAGYSKNGNQNFAVVRYDSAGNLDTSFNGVGYNTTDFTGTNDQGNAIALQTDGKIVVAGATYTASNHVSFGIVRYNSNGTVDTSFNGTGKRTTSFGNTAVAVARKVLVQPDGKILAIGYAQISGNDLFALARYTSAGAADTTFGTSGILTLKLAPVKSYAGQGYAALIQGSGSSMKIIVTGYVWSGSSYDVVVARLTAAGAVDTTFGTSGKTYFSYGSVASDDYGTALAFDALGNILVSGYTTAPRTSFGVARLSASGILDGTFGTGGRTEVSFGGADQAAGISVQADGRLLVAGTSAQDPSHAQIAVTRLNADGSPDTTFNAAGATPSQALILVNDACYGNALRVQTDQNIVVSGYATSGAIQKMTTIRLLASGTLDTSF